MDIEEYVRNRHKKMHLKSSTNHSKYFKNLVTRILLSIILVISLCIFMKLNTNGKYLINKYMLEDSLEFTKINNLFKDSVGKLIPDINTSSSNLVFSSNEYQKLAYVDYYDGVKFNIDKNSAVPILYGGVVVFIGNKDNYDNTIIIQGNDGINYWYGNITNVNVNLYDYLEKDTVIGTSKDEYIYLVLESDGKYIKYNEYLK